MFERFTDSARQAVTGAGQEALALGHREVRSEHLLLALLAVPGPAAGALAAAGVDAASLRARLPRGGDAGAGDLDAGALAGIGIDLDAVRRAADAAFGPGALDQAGPAARGRARLGAEARQSLSRALHAAVRRHDRQVTSGHLLLGVLGYRHNAALTLLAQAGTDIGALRADVERRLAGAA